MAKISFQDSGLGKDRILVGLFRISTRTIISPQIWDLIYETDLNFSSFAGNQSSVQATGPVPTVIKYSSELPVQMDMEVITSHQDTTRRTGTPVVVKNSAGYFASGQSLSPHAVLIETEKNYQRTVKTDTERDYVKNIRTSEQTSESGAEKGANVSHAESDAKINNNNEGIVFSSSNSVTKKPTNLYGSVEESKNYLTKGGNQVRK